MKRITFFLFLSLCSVAVFAQKTWKNDKAHSKLTFELSHLMISDVSGLFKNFDVTIQSDKADFSDAVFSLEVYVNSINTEVSKRDDDLRSDHFFDVQKYPKISFTSSSIKKSGKDRYQLMGNLTMHGITKPVKMDLWYRGTIENPKSKMKTAGFQLTGTLNRSDFQIGPNYPAAMIGDKVNIKADGEFHLADK